MDQQQHYVGLDVSLETTSICVIDEKGTAVWRGKCASTPEAITEAVHTYAPAVVRVGLETEQLSNWLTLNLRRRGLPVVCLDARHAKATLSLQINKTEAGGSSPESQITVRLAAKDGDGPVRPADLQQSDAAAVSLPLPALRSAVAACRFL